MLPKILLGVGIFAAGFSVLIFSGKVPGLGTPSKVVLTGDVMIWGTLPEAPINRLFQEYNAKAKTYRIAYKEVNENVFDQRLVEALANGAGPDLIITPYQTVLSQMGRISPFPVKGMNESLFKNLYVDGASMFFISGYGALALPVSVDPMVLFYNRTLLSKNGTINPPQTWNEVTALIPSLTIQNNRGQFIQSAIALGSENTPYAKDILMAIVGQLGQTPTLKTFDPAGMIYTTFTGNTPVVKGGDVYPLSSSLRFFVQFADPTQKTYTWNQFSGNASDQFVAEKLAMYVGYSSEKASLIARNPRGSGSFEMSIFPQTPEYNTFNTSLHLHGIALLKTTKNYQTALQVQSDFANSNSLSEIAGGFPPFRAYLNTQGIDPVVAKSVLNARGWDDMYPKFSSDYTITMISDVLNNRQTISDAANSFVSRMQDLYTPLR